MKVLTIVQADAIIPRLRPDYERRKSVSQEDWGDNHTILACVRRRKPFEELNIHTDFGTYLGNNIVGVVGIVREVKFCEQYESIADMKDEWVLD